MRLPASRRRVFAGSLIVFAVLLLFASLSAFLKSSGDVAKDRATQYLGWWTNRTSLKQSSFSLVLDQQLPPGRYPGLRPGWIITFAFDSGSTFRVFVALNGEILGNSNPVGMAPISRAWKEPENR